ncbi:zinc carboxypeptidase family protein (macronuclear) [Tetrahymena thermophila SB210]|uniref:Zinc carboxypeptidase family protein n=1 Tax=Tetrahymena thermophila (strain SB210) TaxID=312017 RepID=Q23A57_TETTS|nr:zinc carboxypeptidase family protein [Tetrahymena thermophila SB210]EAR93423.2 zinc carboxypeptidase family protein [Tetrahymena thermophila SB210]|eukprot:XP_001013668.2 zinc carboxypeptidase family protein [Tetrahymena thermophila SB210]
MDQLAPNSIPIQQNCIFHPQNKLAFIQVKEISSLPNSNIFQCVDCFEQDLQFRGANYMLIQKNIENSESDFHYKWPPLNDQQIIQNIDLKAKNLNSTQSVLNQINSYFTQLKDEIIKKIDASQKKAINQALQMPFSKDQILKRYQEISQIQNLKSLLMQDYNKSFELQQKSCKEFIQQVELNKDKNTQLLQELLNQCEQIELLIDFDRLNKSKVFLLDFLDQLNFFEDQTQSQVSSENHLNNIILPQQDNSKIDQLMNLISNKTNYCSEVFLNQIRQQMQKLSLFIEQISFDKMNQEGKKAIRFSELNDKKINSINEYVEHLIKIQDDPQHLQSVKNSVQISNLFYVLDNNFNFISKNYPDNLMRYLIETYPFSKNINTDQMFSEEQSFNILRCIDTNYIKEFVKIGAYANYGSSMIGIMKNENFNRQQGNQDKMSYHFRLQNNKMKYYGGFGIDKFVKGDKTQLLDENCTLELRVWLEGQQVEIYVYISIYKRTNINISQKKYQQLSSFENQCKQG